MDRLQQMSVFVAVAQAESFAGGARRLALSPPAVTRAVAALEQRLGVKLLQRTTRRVRVTEAGRRYLDDAKRILAEIDEADGAAAGINLAPRGLLTLTAPVLFGSQYVTPAIVEFLTLHPDVEVSAVFIDRVVNLLDEGIDVGVRIGALPDSGLRAVRVGAVRTVLCAAPSYLTRRGTPQGPEDLRGHTLITASGVSPGREWKFGPRERSSAVRVAPRLTVTSNDAAIEAAVLGFGITRLLSYQIAPYLAAGTLQIVLGEVELPPRPIHIVHREGRQAPAKIRAFIDLLVARLRADPGLQ